MLMQGVTPKSLPGRHGQAATVRHRLAEVLQSDGLQANVVTYDATISACKEATRWQRAICWLEEMQSQAILALLLRLDVLRH